MTISKVPHNCLCLCLYNAFCGYGYTEEEYFINKSYFNLEGDCWNLQQKFYKLEENSSVLQGIIVTLGKNESSLMKRLVNWRKNSLNFSDNISEIIVFKDKQFQIIKLWKNNFLSILKLHMLFKSKLRSLKKGTLQ